MEVWCAPYGSQEGCCQDPDGGAVEEDGAAAMSFFVFVTLAVKTCCMNRVLGVLYQRDLGLYIRTRTMSGFHWTCNFTMLFRVESLECEYHSYLSLAFRDCTVSSSQLDATHDHCATYQQQEISSEYTSCSLEPMGPFYKHVHRHL